MCVCLCVLVLISKTQNQYRHVIPRTFIGEGRYVFTNTHTHTRTHLTGRGTHLCNKISMTSNNET